jgi:CPA2 family monovalent cation:H+ antiporter-2
VLKSAGVLKARMVIIAFSNPKQALKILKNIRRINKTVPVLVRTTDDSELESLQIAGATEVIPEKLESSLMLASHMLILLGTSPLRTQQQVQEIKANRYRFLQGFYEGEKIGHLESTSAEKTYLHAVELPDSAYAIGRSIEEFVAQKVPIQVASFSRGGYKCSEIAPYTVLQSGDILVLEGTNEDIYNAEEKLLQG